MTIKQKQCFKCKQTVYENDAIQVARKDGSGTFAQKFNEVQCINPHFKTCGKESSSSSLLEEGPKPIITQSKSTAQEEQINTSAPITTSEIRAVSEDIRERVKLTNQQLQDLINTVELIAKKVGVNLPS